MADPQLDALREGDVLARLDDLTQRVKALEDRDVVEKPARPQAKEKGPR